MFLNENPHEPSWSYYGHELNLVVWIATSFTGTVVPDLYTRLPDTTFYSLYLSISK